MWVFSFEDFSSPHPNWGTDNVREEPNLDVFATPQVKRIPTFFH